MRASQARPLASRRHLARRSGGRAGGEGRGGKGRGGKGHAGATAVRAAVATGQRPWQAARVVPVAVHCGPVVVVVPLSLSFVCVSLARRPRAWGRRPGSGEPGERVGALRRPRHVLHHPLRFGASDRDPAFGVLLAIQFEHRDSLTHSLTHSLSLTLTHFHSLSLTHSFRPVISLLILKTGTLETTLLYRAVSRLPPVSFYRVRPLTCSRGRDYHITRRTRHELQAHHGPVALLNRPCAGPALVCEVLV